MDLCKEGDFCKKMKRALAGIYSVLEANLCKAGSKLLAELSSVDSASPFLSLKWFHKMWKERKGKRENAMNGLSISLFGLALCINTYSFSYFE
jgi:hypothetical protein